jgi:replicative superfamily II helicase
MVEAIYSGSKLAYVTHLKAIVEEQVEEWEKEYPKIHLGLYTGDFTKVGAKPKDEDLLLFLPEKFAGMDENPNVPA